MRDEVTTPRLPPLDAGALFVAVVENSQDAIIAQSPTGVILSWNRAAQRIYGYVPEEMIGREIAAIVPEDKAGELPSLYARVLNGEDVGWIETARITKDGRRIEISLTLSAIYDVQKTLVGFSSIARGVTERNRAIAEDRRRQRLLTDSVENATEGLHWVGPDGTILWANRAEFESLDYTAEEYIGHNIAEFHADEPVICDILRRLTAGEKLEGYEARMRRKNGAIQHVLINSSVYFEDGEFVHTRCFTRDITARREAQKALEAAQNKLREHAAELECQVAARTADLQGTVQSLEGLCYTMAHDLRAPLRSLQTFSELLASEHASQLDADGRANVERIQATTRRMDENSGPSRICAHQPHRRSDHGSRPRRPFPRLGATVRARVGETGRSAGGPPPVAFSLRQSRAPRSDFFKSHRQRPEVYPAREAP